MPQQDNFQQSFERLKSLLKEHEPSFRVRTDGPDTYDLVGPTSDARKGELHFGSVHLKKTYVSYHLLPVSRYPELLENLSPELRTRMLGKSCFNFKSVNDTILSELAQLTETCAHRLQTEGLA